MNKRWLRRTCASRFGRRGAVFLEMAISCALLAILMALLAQTGVIFLRQQKSASLREYAAREAANLLDQTRTTPYEQLTVERLSTTTVLPAAAAKELDGQVAWEVTDGKDETLQSRRIKVTLTWSDRGAAKSITLSTWRFQSAPLEEASS